MAFTASAVLEVQTGGDDTNNGGIFDTGVAGFPTDGAATSATGSAPVFTSASYNFVAGDVNAWIYIKSGTNWTPGWYQIASVAANAATLTASIGSAVLSNFSLSTVAGCATTASPTSATWGIDYSQSSSSRFTFTDMVIGGTTTQFTSAGNPVGKNFVGNSVSVTSGTGFTVQRVAVASTSGTTATCDKSLGTGGSTGGNGRLGGALASPGLAASLRVAGNTCFIKTGTYAITSASTNISGGCVSDAVGGQVITWEGYQTTRGDLGTAPLLQAGNISTFVLFAMTSGATAGSIIRNISVDGVSKTSSQGVNLARRAVMYKCAAANCTNVGINCAASNLLVKCISTGCSGGAAAILGGYWILCEAYSNTIPGFGNVQTNAPQMFCLSYNNTGASSDGFLASSGNAVFVGCVAYGNGRDGFRFGVGETQSAINCIAEGNTGVGFNATTSAIGAAVTRLNCAAYSNTGGNVAANVTGPNIGFVTGTSSFFVAAGSSNFALNSTASAGASARAAGVPGTYPAGLTTGYLDIGAAQHLDSYPFPLLGSGSFAIQ